MHILTGWRFQGRAVRFHRLVHMVLFHHMPSWASLGHAVLFEAVLFAHEPKELGMRGLQ